MSTGHRPGVAHDGTRLQTAVKKRHSAPRGFSSKGLHLEAVVVATYVYDEPEGANNSGTPAESKAIYCDLLTVGRWTMPIHRALVMQSRGGIHSADLWIPRAAAKTADAPADGFNKNRASVPSQSDGAHVVVTFLEDNFQKPLIIGALPHPNADVGNQAKLLGHRIRPVVQDGEVSLIKNRGSFVLIDDDGNTEVNTTRAHDGTLLDDLAEPEPVLDGTVGNQVHTLPEGSTFEVIITKDPQVGDGSDASTEWTRVLIANDSVTVLNSGGESLELLGKDAATTLKIGDGAMHAAIVEHLETLWTAKLVAYVDAHTHPSGVGPTGPPVTKMADLAPWDAGINSTKVSIPDA